MPMWPHTISPAADRARTLHAELTGAQPTGVASAPATWAMIGEHTDAYGGLTAIGLAQLRAAAAVSPRKDPTIAVTIVSTQADGATETTTHETTLEQLNELAAAQQPTTDSEGQPVIPPAPTGGDGQRAAGLVWMLVNRQMLSRDTAGMDITVVTDIPAHAGLGAAAAMDVAVTLALIGDSVDTQDVPLRARLADICAQSATLFAAAPVVRARHTAALRGAGETMSVIDYSDNSVTQAPHPLGRELAGFVLAVPGAHDQGPAMESLRQRQRFVADACRAFGTENLRLLPDASLRVVDWFTAVHEVHGSEGKPTIAEATQWLGFFEDETERAQGVARALRSRRGSELFDNLGGSQLAVESVFGLDSAERLAELAVMRGAAGARAASAGMANAVVAYVPVKHAENFAADLAADGMDVVALELGEPAAHH